ncbi:MAG TPA: VWA domain-containing protein [Vicinamibacterales bacterium]|nr:VWA domain-containing protein [Vicinamibacterales bacterium]
MRRRIAPSALVLLLSSVGLSAQQQPTFRSKTELVIVDAVVVDKDGNAVRGLKASDFALTDRKKPQLIATFEEVSHQRSADVIAAPALPATLKLDVASNMTVQADRLVMVLIDDLHIWKGRTEKAKALANDIVARLGPEASMSVLFTSREGSTEITQDRSVLSAAIDRMEARQTFRRPHQGFPKPGPGFIDPGVPIELRLDLLNEAAKTSLQERNDNFQFQETLKDAARMLLAEDRRRKAFVLVSEGFDVRLDRDELVGQEVNISAGIGRNAMDNMIGALRGSNVALYAIDPRGKVRAEDMMRESWPPPDCAVCNNPPLQLASAERARNREDSQFAWDNPVRKAQGYLADITQAQGGFAVTDTDDLTGGLGRILEDLDHYYLLGFYPPDAMDDSKTHPVGVTVPGHPDYKVRFRRGYSPDAPVPPLTSKDPLGELAAGVMPKSDLPLRLTAMPLPGAGKKESVIVALEVTAPVGLMKESDSKLRDDISYSVIVVDDKRARVTDRTGRSATFSMRAKDPGQREPDTVTYQIPLTIDLAPGRYQLRASAMSKKVGKGGSVYLDLTVPDFSKMPLALTSIALGFADGPRVPVGRTTVRIVPGAAMSAVPPAQERARNNKNPLPFEPTLSREFERSDALRAYLQVVRRAATGTVALEIRVLDANDVAQLTYDRILGADEPSLLDLRIPLEKLAPGAYILRVTAGDSRNRARTETGFIVK